MGTTIYILSISSIIKCELKARRNIPVMDILDNDNNELDNDEDLEILSVTDDYMKTRKILEEEHDGKLHEVDMNEHDNSHEHEMHMGHGRLNYEDGSSYEGEL